MFLCSNSNSNLISGFAENASLSNGVFQQVIRVARFCRVKYTKMFQIIYQIYTKICYQKYTKYIPKFRKKIISLSVKMKSVAFLNDVTNFLLNLPTEVFLH